MSLYLAPLYESMVRQFSTTTSDGRFKEDFIAACNLVFDQLSFAASLDTAIEHTDATDATVSELDSEQSYIVTAGLIFNLVNMGQKHVRGDAAYIAAKTEWEDGKGDYQVMKRREDQSSVDDDGEPDDQTIGLGYSGDF